MVSYNSSFGTPKLPDKLKVNFIQKQLNKTTEKSGKPIENPVSTARQGLIGNVTRDELLRAKQGNESEEELTIVVQGFSMNEGDEIELLDEFTGLNYVISKDRDYKKNTDLNVYEATRRK